MARKKKKRSKRSKNINWGQGMASFGDINATLGLVFAWIMMFGCIGFGLYLIIQGAQGKPINSIDGTCNKADNSFSNYCYNNLNETSCTSDTKDNCVWRPTGSTKLSGGGQAGYIVGGLFTILFGIGIVMIANWVRNKTRSDRNFAAVVGTGALAEGFASAFGGGR
jgi:hypothetical protein